MKQFIVLAVAATLFSLVIAQGYETIKDDSYASHSGRYGSRYGSQQGYGYAYKRCPKLEDPENGSVKFYSLRPGSKAIHSCDEGYILTGEKVRVCQKDGTWSGEAPTCEPVECGKPDPANRNGSVEYVGTTFGEIATYSCNIGFKLDETQTGRRVVVCLASGEWSDTAPICKPVKCGTPPQPDVNGEVEFTTTDFQSEATYTCIYGYELPNDAATVVLTCQYNSDWSDVAPECSPVNCGPAPAANANGDVIVGTTTFKSTAVYVCDSGYVLDKSNGGVQQVYCQGNGEWSGIAPLHARIDCGYLASPQNGDVTFNTDTRLDSYAEFTCNRGFRLVGDAARQCEYNGDWSLESPICERIECPRLAAPAGGKVIVSGYYVDDYAIYRCGYGYSLSGDKRRVCQDDGTWSGTEPTCDYNDKYDYDYGHDGYGDRHYGRYDSKKDY